MDINKIRKKRGFTFVELIVVLAIIVALSAMILPAMMDKSGDIANANSRAEDFYLATQSTFMTFELSEDPIVTYAPSEIQYISYVGTDRKNKILTGALYIEAHCTPSGFEYVRVSDTLKKLCCTDDPNYIVDEHTTLGDRILQDLSKKMSSMSDGYYYVAVDSSFRILSTQYSKAKFEYLDGEFSTTTKAMFTSDGICNDNVVGSCTSVNWTKAGDASIDYHFLGEVGSYFLQVFKDDISGSFVY